MAPSSTPFDTGERYEDIAIVRRSARGRLVAVDATRRDDATDLSLLHNRVPSGPAKALS